MKKIITTLCLLTLSTGLSHRVFSSGITEDIQVQDTQKQIPSSNASQALLEAEQFNEHNDASWVNQGMRQSLWWPFSKDIGDIQIKDIASLSMTCKALHNLLGPCLKKKHVRAVVDRFFNKEIVNIYSISLKEPFMSVPDKLGFTCLDQNHLGIIKGAEKLPDTQHLIIKSKFNVVVQDDTPFLQAKTTQTLLKFPPGLKTLIFSMRVTITSQDLTCLFTSLPSLETLRLPSTGRLTEDHLKAIPTTLTRMVLTSNTLKEDLKTLGFQEEKESKLMVWFSRNL